MTHHRIIDAERDAESARLRLEQTLDELRGRLTPGRMLDEALDFAREGSVGQFARNFGGQVKHNPMPVALVGVGLAWLMMGRGGSTADNNWDYETRYRSAGDGLSREDMDGSSTLKDKASRAASMAGDAANAAYGSASSAYESASGMAHDARDRANRLAGQASRMGRQTTNTITRMFDEQPLLLGILGLTLGAVLGGALPGTRTEDRLAGKASDDFKEQAGREMNRQAEKGMHVAERAYEGAMQEGQRAASEEGWAESKEIEGDAKTIDQEHAR